MQSLLTGITASSQAVFQRMKLVIILLCEVRTVRCIWTHNIHPKFLMVCGVHNCVAWITLQTFFLLDQLDEGENSKFVVFQDGNWSSLLSPQERIL